MAGNHCSSGTALTRLKLELVDPKIEESLGSGVCHSLIVFAAATRT